MTTLRLEHLDKTYPGASPVHALKDVSLMINQGEYVAIQGPSGSGKSTLLNQLALLDAPSGGEYYLDGVLTNGLSDKARAELRSSTFAFIFQAFHLLDARTVLDNVSIGTLYRGLAKPHRDALSEESLGFVGLSEKAPHKAKNLSGGERQRVAIARAIAAKAPIIVADEPTGNLDSAVGQAVMDALERLHAQGSTLIVVTHDPQIAARATRQLHVLDGHVTADAPEPEASPATPPSPEGAASKIHVRDALADAWRGLWSKPTRTLGLVAAVALAVGLVLTTVGLAQTARYQVSDIFDAGRNRMVSMVSPYAQLDEQLSAEFTSPDGLRRILDVAGVEHATIFVEHERVRATAHPETSDAPGIDGTFDLAGVVDGHIDTDLFAVDTGGVPLETLADDQVIVGIGIAQDLELGPLLASPTLWLDGQPKYIVGILTDPGLQLQLTTSIITTETTASTYGPPTYAHAELKTASGAAQQVASQAPIAWAPAGADYVSVKAPPDPQTLRAEVETNVTTILLTLSAVTLIGAILALTNTMTTAVIERRSEFGLRRAIGAKRTHITGLVLTEALTIGALGGIAGTYLATLALLGTTLAQGWQPVLDPATIPIGILTGITIATLSSLLATVKAAQTQPTEALHS